MIADQSHETGEITPSIECMYVPKLIPKRSLSVKAAPTFSPPLPLLELILHDRSYHRARVFIKRSFSLVGVATTCALDVNNINLDLAKTIFRKIFPPDLSILSKWDSCSREWFEEEGCKAVKRVDRDN